MHPKLGPSFYLKKDVVQSAKELIGKKLCTHIGNNYTAGIITETEAYAGVLDKASHAYGNRRSPRNENMYKEGGIAYIYLCYGIHHLFNVVTNEAGTPHAILVRGIQITEGIAHALKRRKQVAAAKNTSSGPGTLSQALGITTALNGADLRGTSIWIEESGLLIDPDQIETGPRIGVDYAGEDAKLPYRFLLKS